MESAVRYDFSFPPKSVNLNQMNPCGMSNTPVTTSHAHAQQQQHTIHNIRQQSNQYQFHHNVSTGLGLSKSASTSLLSCASTQNNNVLKQLTNNYCYNCNSCNSSNSSNCSHGLKSKANHNVHHSVKPTAYGLLQQQQSNLHGNIVPMMAPATPKDSNCSFTFDDLKNTLAFMEDSPLINPNGNTVNMANANAVISNQVLMVIPNASSVDCTSLSSSSSLSSSGSSTSSCSSTSCCAMNFIPKSNSNPMLSSTSSSNTSSNSPTSLNQPINKSTECVCLKPAQKSVLDLFIKKTPETGSYDSLITTTSLLANAQAANNTVINTAIETAAKKYRCAAQVSEATCCWKGKLPPKQYKTPIVYSTKVFVGGLPWDITEDDIVKEFGVFGPCRVEWTNKEKFNLLSSAQSDYNNNNQFNRQNRSMGNLHKINQPNQQQNQDPLNSSKHRLSPGFAYVIYESEYSVRSLVGNCIEDYQNGRDRVEYYFKISTRRVRNKEVQIIPWILADNNFALCTPKELDPKKTVFVGNLHGTMTARDLAHIMNELFGCVVYAGIDIDKLKYPIGSGRVTFSHQQNFMRAVRAAFVDIQSSKFSKRIQIDPYLEDVQCCSCFNDKGIYFCRDFQCFNYYCGQCWDKQHSFNQLGNHKPLMRKREDKF